MDKREDMTNFEQTGFSSVVLVCWAFQLHLMPSRAMEPALRSLLLSLPLLPLDSGAYKR